MSETCATCRFWVPPPEDSYWAGEGEPPGECHRWSPNWPPTPGNEWCGEYQARPRRFENRPCILVDDWDRGKFLHVRCLTCGGTQKEAALFEEFACELAKPKQREPGWYWVKTDHGWRPMELPAGVDFDGIGSRLEPPA